MLKPTVQKKKGSKGIREPASAENPTMSAERKAYMNSLSIQRDIFHRKFIFHRFHVGEDGNHATQRRSDIGFKIFSNVMRIVDGPLTGDQHVHRDKSARRGLAGTEGMEANALFTIFLYDLLD